MKKIDPELQARIKAEGAVEHDVGAVITVQDLSPKAKPLAPEETTEIVEKLVERVRSATGISPSELTIQRNLGTFLVHAKPRFIETLLDQSEVHHAASVNDVDNDRILIRPTKRKPKR